MSPHGSHSSSTGSNQPARRTSSNHQDAPQRVVYKAPDNPHSPEFFVLAHRGMVEKWRKDKSVPMVEVVQAFHVYVSETGHLSGKAVQPSKQLLSGVFPSENETEIVQYILEHGDVK